MNFGPPCYEYALNGHFVYLATLGTRPLFIKKNGLIYLMPQKMNFTPSVQIKMKQVSFNLKVLIALLGTTVLPIRHILDNTTHTLLLFCVFTIKYCITFMF